MQGLRELQLQRELESDSEASTRKLREYLTAAQEGSLEHPKARSFMAGAYNTVFKLIEEYKAKDIRGHAIRHFRWLRSVPSDIAAVIAIREVLRACTDHRSDRPVVIQNLAVSVGKLYELEVRIQEAFRVNPVYMDKVRQAMQHKNVRNQRHLAAAYYKAYKRVTQKQVLLKLPQRELFLLGKWGVSACYEAGIIHKVPVLMSKGTGYSYELHPDVRTYLNAYTENDVQNIIAVETGAMVCPPDPWRGIYGGGYLTPRRKAVNTLVSTRKLRRGVQKNLKSDLTPNKAGRVLEVANYLQSTPWEVFTPTLNHVVQIWHSGGGVLGVPTRNTPPKPEFPFESSWNKNEASEEELRIFSAWRSEATEYYTNLRKWRSRVQEIGGLIRTLTKEHTSLWFPTYTDTRGRWYYRGYPNPQGSDIAKSCLRFSEKKPLGKRGVYWLKVQIANSYGHDKVSLDERAAWTEENWEAIQRALKAPSEHLDVWGTDAPWMMFTTAYELSEALQSDNPEEYLSGLPVSVDATCSGIQHFSAMLLDPIGAEQVNILPRRDGTKADIYTKVAEATLQSIHEDLENPNTPENTRVIAEFWEKVGIPRSMAKKPVMTRPYGATLLGTIRSIQHYVQTEMPEVIIPPEHDYKYCTYLAKKIFKGVDVAVPAMHKVMGWLRETIAKREDPTAPIVWRTPLGFPVHHSYPKKKDKWVSVQSCGLTQVLFREFSRGTNTITSRNAMSPNFVHSLDSAHLGLVALRMRDLGLTMLGIHDSFGTHACDVDALQRVIREEFVHLYKDRNVLQELHDTLGCTTEPPKQGDLDITKVLDSEFFFS